MRKKYKGRGDDESEKWKGGEEGIKVSKEKGGENKRNMREKGRRRKDERRKGESG